MPKSKIPVFVSDESDALRRFESINTAECLPEDLIGGNDDEDDDE